MTDKRFTLSILRESFAVCRLNKDAEIPDWAHGCGFYSITRTGDELSIVCLESNAPAGVRQEAGYRCLKIHGPLDFSLTGVIATIAGALARARISIFAVSTYDTDYLLVKERDLGEAVRVLSEEGHFISKGA